MPTVFENLKAVLDPSSGVEDDGSVRGTHVALLYYTEDKASPRDTWKGLGPLSIRWQIEDDQLRITGLEHPNLTATMLRVPLEDLKDAIVAQLQAEPELASGSLRAYRRLMGAAPTERAREAMEKALTAAGFGGEVAEKQEGRLTRARDYETLTSARLQRSGFRVNAETKYRICITYIQVCRDGSQSPVPDTQAILDRMAEHDEIPPEDRRSVSSTQLRRWRREDPPWLMEAMQGVIGAGPGEAMFNWAGAHAPDEIPDLEECRAEWQANLDKKYDEDPKYRAQREAREETE